MGSVSSVSIRSASRSVVANVAAMMRRGAPTAARSGDTTSPTASLSAVGQVPAWDGSGGGAGGAGGAESGEGNGSRAPSTSLTVASTGAPRQLEPSATQLNKTRPRAARANPAAPVLALARLNMAPPIRLYRGTPCK